MTEQIDVTDFVPGDVIDRAECERLIGYSFGSRDYDMHLMILANKIERALWRLGRRYTVATKKGAIHVLTPKEAVDYNAALFESGKRKMRKSHKRACAIDTQGLSTEERRQLADNLAKQGRVLSAMRSRQPIEVPAVTRITPRRSGA